MEDEFESLGDFIDRTIFRCLIEFDKATDQDPVTDTNCSPLQGAPEATFVSLFSGLGSARNRPNGDTQSHRGNESTSSRPKPKTFIKNECDSSRPKSKNFIKNECDSSRPKSKTFIKNECDSSRPKSKTFITTKESGSSRPKSKTFINQLESKEPNYGFFPKNVGLKQPAGGVAEERHRQGTTEPVTKGFPGTPSASVPHRLSTEVADCPLLSRTLLSDRISSAPVDLRMNGRKRSGGQSAGLAKDSTSVSFQRMKKEQSSQPTKKEQPSHITVPALYAEVCRSQNSSHYPYVQGVVGERDSSSGTPKTDLNSSVISRSGYTGSTSGGAKMNGDHKLAVPTPNKNSDSDRKACVPRPETVQDVGDRTQGDRTQTAVAVGSESVSVTADSTLVLGGLHRRRQSAQGEFIQTEAVADIQPLPSQHKATDKVKKRLQKRYYETQLEKHGRQNANKKQKTEHGRRIHIDNQGKTGYLKCGSDEDARNQVSHTGAVDLTSVAKTKLSKKPKDEPEREKIRTLVKQGL